MLRGLSPFRVSPYGQNINPNQFPDQRYRVNGHHRQPRAKPLNPACTAAAPGEHEPSALPSAVTGSSNTPHGQAVLIF